MRGLSAAIGTSHRQNEGYSHGAKYLRQLALLADDANKTWPSGMVDHPSYLASLKKTHPRKAGF
ncbi:MAG: hypothetical protein ABJP82_00070 [Hyphomicrobiales bacterium]